MAEVVVKKSNKLGGKIWASIVLFGFMGQLAWMVENMYFSTYIQKNITDQPWGTSATVIASAIVAALVTIFGGVLSDRLGKRRVFVCWGYIIWGLVTASFAFFGHEHVAEDDVLKMVIIFVVMDCVMTVFGSMSNDAAFSSWVTDVTDITNRGFVDIILSIMPVAALLAIFVFDMFTVANGKWEIFFIVLGALPTITGVIGLFILRDNPRLKPDKSGKYMEEVIYGFKPSSIKRHKMIYICLVGMMIGGLAMQMWQPYMIMLLQYTLGFKDGFILPLAIVILLSAAIAVVGGKLLDKYGKEKLFYPVAAMGVVGGLLAYVCKFVNNNMTAIYILFILGGTMIEGASLLTAGLFNATARDYTPEEKAGCFQGIRIIIFVMLPMIIASLLCPAIIKGFGPEVRKFGESPAAGYIIIEEGMGYLEPFIKDGAEVVSHVYPFELFLFSAVVALFNFIPTYFVHKENKKFRAEKLQQLNVETVTNAQNVQSGALAHEEAADLQEANRTQEVNDVKADKGSDGKE